MVSEAIQSLFPNSLTDKDSAHMSGAFLKKPTRN